MRACLGLSGRHERGAEQGDLIPDLLAGMADRFRSCRGRASSLNLAGH
jgi:hypothetical protein